MKLESLPLARIDWARVDATAHQGERGTAAARTYQAGDVRLRLVEYSPGYVADHWCLKGHLVLLLEGRLTLELKGREPIQITPGQGLVVADDDVPHRALTDVGAKVFLVD